MKLVYYIFSFGAYLIGTGAFAQINAPLSGYNLVWLDEFNGSQLDTDKWIYRVDSKHWSTQEPKNVSVSNGQLVITVKKESSNGKQYTAGGVISRDAFRYGYYEARLKIPQGGGWHTSFWMMLRSAEHVGKASNAAPQELDVFENDSVNPFRYSVNTHRWKPTPHKSYGHKFVVTPDLSADFHVFGCEFTPEAVRYFFDGNLVQTVDASEFPHGDLNIWLTTIASHLGRTITVDDEKLPSTAEFDWVRYYAKK